MTRIFFRPGLSPRLHLVLLFVLLVNLPLVLFAQLPDGYAYESNAEKVYLQLDSKLYTIDRTIWFKCVVTNASDHYPSSLSRVLYVELIDQNEIIIDKKRIKLANGIGSGYFDLDSMYAEGTYLIRAYTEWNKNFGSDFIFEEYVEIYNPLIEKAAGIVQNISLLGKQLKTDYEVQPLEYKAIQRDSIHLQFFPESGELVQGLNSKVGFKATNLSGHGIKIQGEVLNKEGELLTRFQSNDLGMGFFNLYNVDSSASYYARIFPSSPGAEDSQIPLPEVSRSGNILSVIKNGKNFRLIVASNYLYNDSIYFQIACRGEVLYDLKACLKEGVFSLTLPGEMLPEGVIGLTMMDHVKQHVATRLFFNSRPDQQLRLDLKTDKDIYLQRDLTKLEVLASRNSGETVDANLSLLVLNKDQLGDMQHSRQNILSHFLLCSDIRGVIEKPGYYVGADTCRYDDIDALLLTQGWSKYHYTRVPKQYKFLPENQLSLTGSVSGKLTKKSKKEVELTMMTFGDTRAVYTTTTDSLGSFRFSLNDEAEQQLEVLIQSANKNDKKRDFSITLDPHISPEVSFTHKKPIEKADSTVDAYIDMSSVRKNTEEMYRLSANAIELEEVVVEGYQMTPERAKVTADYGKPDQIFSGEAIEEKEEKWSFGIYSVLQEKFPEKITIRRIHSYRGTFLYASARGSAFGWGFEWTLVLVDGIPVRIQDYYLIQYIPPSEVSSFEIIESPKNFYSLYREVLPFVKPDYVPSNGSIIAIYTHAGKGLRGTTRPTGILKTSIPGFSPTTEFYAPKYDNLKEDDWYNPDLRSLVHWQPNIETDSTGQASMCFYNADLTGEMLIVVEAISDAGEIGYSEIVFPVIEKEMPIIVGFQ